jgi:hypothetical protein
MTVSSMGSRQGLRGQLNKLRNLAQPFFLPLDQASGWQFAGLLVALLFCVGGLVLVALTGLINGAEQLLPDLTAKYFGGVSETIDTIWSSAWGVVFSGLFLMGGAAFLAMRQQLRNRRWLHWLMLGVIVLMLLTVKAGRRFLPDPDHLRLLFRRGVADPGVSDLLHPEVGNHLARLVIPQPHRRLHAQPRLLHPQSER